MMVLVSHRDGMLADAIRSCLVEAGMHADVRMHALTADDVTSCEALVLDAASPHFAEVRAQLAALATRPRVVALVDEGSAPPRSAAAVVDAWVTSADSIDELLRAVRAEGDGTPEPWASEPRDSTASRYRLTPRESEVLARLLRGESTKTMAAKMNVSPATARTHVQNVLAKLGAHSRLEAVSLVSDASFAALVEGREGRSGLVGSH
jgi:two-component system nitrate/nitrite response regulator NarL